MNKISISGAAFSVNHCARLIGIVYPVQPAFPRARQIFFFDASTAFYIAILSSGYPSRAFKMFPERKKREKLLPQNSFLYNTHLLSISARRKIPKDSFWPRDFLHRLPSNIKALAREPARRGASCFQARRLPSPFCTRRQSARTFPISSPRQRDRC